MIKVFVFDYRPILKRQMFENLTLLKSKFSYLTIGKYQKSDVSFLKFKFSYLTIRENQKVTFIKEISMTTEFSIWPWRLGHI